MWIFALETTTGRVKGCNNIGTVPFNLLVILEIKELKNLTQLSFNPLLHLLQQNIHPSGTNHKHKFNWKK